MASKLAVAGLMKEASLRKGLAAMSDVQGEDMTSQMAKELMLGITTMWRNVAATFKKMAFGIPTVRCQNTANYFRGNDLAAGTRD